MSKKSWRYHRLDQKRQQDIPGWRASCQGLSSEIRRAEVVVIMGPSGSGKSTLLRCINGLEEPDSGAIVVDGIPLDDNKRIASLSVKRWDGFSGFNLFSPPDRAGKYQPGPDTGP